MPQSQLSDWENDLKISILKRDTRNTIRLIREKPNGTVRLGTRTSPLLYILFSFQYLPISEKDLDFIDNIVRLYCREFRNQLNEYHPIPIVCEWKNDAKALKFIRLLKSCRARTDREFGNYGSYMLWYLNRYVPYKYAENTFNVEIFKELYVEGDDTARVGVDIVCLQLHDFKKAIEFLYNKGVINVNNNRIIYWYIEVCLSDTHYREKIDFLLEMGFSLPNTIIKHICKYGDYDNMIDFIKYVIEKGAKHDTKEMSIALINIIKRSVKDPFQLKQQQKEQLRSIRQQQTQQRQQQLQFIRQTIDDENTIQKIIKFLCENGADIDFKYHRKTAIDIAINKKSREILLLLLHYMKDPTPAKLQQIMGQCQRRSIANPIYQSMKEDVQGLKRFLSTQKLLSKRSFSNVDLARQFSTFFTKKSRI
jgi:hypothetical protein